MRAGAGRGSHSWGGVKGWMLGVAGAVAVTTAANAVVVEGLNIILPPPAGGWVGGWNGSSGVPVSQYWVLTARHVGGSAGQHFVMRGQWYLAAEIRQHPTLDLQLIRVTTPMPAWHAIAPQQFAGTAVYLGGCGHTTQSPLPNNQGWDWGGERFEAWGRNRIETAGSMLRIRFDAPGANAEPQEGAFALNDSGAGLFVMGPNGQLQLAGTAVTVSGGGASTYGSSCYCVALHTAQPWISSNIGGQVDPPFNCNMFDFLSRWFARDMSADFDGNSVIDVADIFSYLGAWFETC